MCFGSDGGSSSTIKLPPWLEDFAEETIGQAEEVTTRPYEPYPGERLAPFSDLQQQGFEQVSNTAGSYQPYLDQASGILGGIADMTIQPFSEVDLDPYMSPYTDQVIADTTGQISRQGDVNQNQITADMQTTGAYGGDRDAILSAENTRNTQQEISESTARLSDEAYQNATSAYYADINNQLALGTLQGNTAGQIADIGALGTTLGYADAGALLDAGSMQQQQQQSGLDIGYQDFLDQWNYPIEMLNLRTGLASGQPYSQNQTTEGPGGSSGAQGLGAFASLVGGLGNIFG